MKFSEINASQIYFRLQGISGCENFLSKIRRFIKLQKKTNKNMWNVFFQFLKLNISSIKELLHKPSEIQWNITGTLPEKLKRKSYWALSLQKREKLLFLGVLWGPGSQCGIPWFFMILWISESFSLYLFVKNRFNFKLGFYTYFEYISWDIITKTFYIQITIVSGDIDVKKARKTFHKLHIKIFLNVSLWILHCYEQLWFRMFVKTHFQGVKVEKIAFIKYTFSLQKNPPELQVSMS